MATVAIDETNSTYVPFRGIVGRSPGPVATLDLHGDATGDGSAGTVQIQFTATRLMFGFHPILVPRMVDADDNLAAAERVRVGFEATNNERLSESHQVIAASFAQQGTVNVNTLDREQFALLIEPETAAAGLIYTFNWATNTNLKVYHAHAFHLVYDAEAMARDGVYLETILG